MSCNYHPDRKGIKSLNTGKFVGVFLYLKKAFDTVNHTIIIKKTTIIWITRKYTCLVIQLSQ